MKRWRWALTLVALAGPAGAQQSALQPGEYLDGSGGYLIINPAKAGSLPFEIQTIGPNRHGCQADGVIGKDLQAVLKPDGAAPCILAFAPKSDRIEVTVKTVCSAYCGARASLDGMYFKPAPGCDRAGVRKSHAEFKRLYDKKAYREARAALEPVLTRCSNTLDDNEDGWMRNDLAITFLRLGDRAACRRALEPLAKDAAKSDASIREELLPADARRLIPIMQATRTNLKLCQAPGK